MTAPAVVGRSRVRRALVGLAFVACAWGLLAGCTPAPASSYRVQLSPAFTADQQESILAAVDDWRAVVPVHFDVAVSACSGDDDCRICVAPSYETQGEPLGRTERRWWLSGESATSTLFVACIAETTTTLEEAAAHELGHAMALEHTGPGTLMCADGTCMAPKPVAEDVSQWWGLRSGTWR